MFLLVLWGIFAGAATVETVKYHQCDAIDFKSKLCHFEKKLKENGPKR